MELVNILRFICNDFMNMLISAYRWLFVPINIFGFGKLTPLALISSSFLAIVVFKIGSNLIRG